LRGFGSGAFAGGALSGLIGGSAIEMLRADLQPDKSVDGRRTTLAPELRGLSWSAFVLGTVGAIAMAVPWGAPQTPPPLGQCRSAVRFGQRPFLKGFLVGSSATVALSSLASLIRISATSACTGAAVLECKPLPAQGLTGVGLGLGAIGLSATLISLTFP
jgi:hypothetical protein